MIGDDHKRNSGADLPIITDIYLMSFNEMTGQMEPGLRDEYRRVIQEAADEVVKAKRGIAMTVEYRIVVGQKKG